MKSSASWAEQLGVLVELQKLDTRLFQLQKERGEIPERKKVLQDAFEAKKGGLKAAEEAFKQSQLKQKEQEKDLAAREEAVRKYETQQMQVKTNKEYSALTHEIQKLKADCSVYEDEILGLMDTIEARKKTVNEERVRLAEEEKSLKAELAGLDTRDKELAKEIDAMTGERGRHLPQVDKDILAHYEKVLKKREGTALVPLEGQTCGACHMTVTHQTVNEIRLKEKIIECETCGRILYEPD